MGQGQEVAGSTADGKGPGRLMWRCWAQGPPGQVGRAELGTVAFVHQVPGAQPSRCSVSCTLKQGSLEFPGPLGGWDEETFGPVHDGEFLSLGHTAL
jgi:hypothetical protein